MPAPTYGVSELPDYRGWFPGDPNRKARPDIREPDAGGELLRLKGRVLRRSGAPIEGVSLEFWQASPAGRYEMDKFRFTGSQRSAADGAYALDTIIPGYAGRIRNINCLAILRGEPGHTQPLLLVAPIHFATDQEFEAPIAKADMPYVRPGARRPQDDASFLRISALPLENGVRQARYDIVFDLA